MATIPTANATAIDAVPAVPIFQGSGAGQLDWQWRIVPDKSYRADRALEKFRTALGGQILSKSSNINPAIRQNPSNGSAEATTPRRTKKMKKAARRRRVSPGQKSNIFCEGDLVIRAGLIRAGLIRASLIGASLLGTSLIDASRAA